MSDRGIIFSAPMVRALLDGRKTQTRRAIKARGVLPDFCGGDGDDENDPEVWGWEDTERGEWITLDQWRRWTFVPYRPGDRLWVREAWKPGAWREDGRVAVDYRASPEATTTPWCPVRVPVEKTVAWHTEAVRNGAKPGVGGVLKWELGQSPLRWRPSIHMPRWASRLTLVVTDVRVQRLQEISGADCIAEGVTCETCAASWSVGRSACNQRGCFEIRQNFRDLWNSLHGPDAWDQNPWVCALTFAVHRCNIDQMEPAA